MKLVKTLDLVSKIILGKNYEPFILKLGIGLCSFEELEEHIKMLFVGWRFLIANRQCLLAKKSIGMYKQFILEKELDMFKPFLYIIFIPYDNSFGKMSKDILYIQRAWNLALGTYNQDYLNISPIKIVNRFNLLKEIEYLKNGSLQFDINSLTNDELDNLKYHILWKRKLFSLNGLLQFDKREIER